MPQRETCAMALEKELLKSLSSAEAAGIKFLLGFPFPPLLWFSKEHRSLLVWGHLEAVAPRTLTGAGVRGRASPMAASGQGVPGSTPTQSGPTKPMEGSPSAPEGSWLCWVLACRSELGTSQPPELGLPVCKRRSGHSLARGLWRKQGFRASQGLYVGFATRTPLSPLPPVKVELI